MSRETSRLNLVLRSYLSDLFRLLSLNSPATLPNGSTLLRLTNTIPGKTNFLQSSSDLVNWSTISTNVSVTNWIDIVDTTTRTTSNRFYRVYQVP